MRTSVISLGLAIIIGVGVGLLLQSPNTPPVNGTFNDTSLQTPTSNKSESNGNTHKQIDAIRQQLTQEINARKKLQKNVENLTKKLALLQPQTLKTGDTKKSEPANNPTTHETENSAWFNKQALINAGVDPETAETLKSRYETQELEKLYVRDQAMREGWFGSRRYRDELEKLDAQLNGLQNELGDKSYAAYLFATGQANRVTVQSVLAKSSADIAGLRTDDQILRYGSQRIYNWRDLRQATTQGDVNETVAIEVIRDGKTMELYVQRGPLGIRMSSTSLAP